MTRTGDLWLLGKHRILCGDATSTEDLTRLMDGDRARMSFCDPPWNVAIGLDKNPRHKQREGLHNDNLSPEDFAAFLSKFAAGLHEIADGDVWCTAGSGASCGGSTV